MTLNEKRANARRTELLYAVEELIKNNSNLEAEADDAKLLDNLDFVSNSGAALYLKYRDDYGTCYKITVTID